MTPVAGFESEWVDKKWVLNCTENIVWEFQIGSKC